MKSKISFSNATFGSRLLETITDGLYDGNVNCLREYVQNAIDSKSKNVEIYFENSNRNLIIRDDGHGMAVNKLIDSLKIGKSDKKGPDVGWRGIGIWSGVSASEKMVIITSAFAHFKDHFPELSQTFHKPQFPYPSTPKSPGVCRLNR
jgi:hypothetical protein